MDNSRAVIFECMRCEDKQKGEYNPKKTVRCKSCGNIAYPVEGYLPKAPPQIKVCRYCKGRLRSGNGSGVCSACDRD